MTEPTQVAGEQSPQPVKLDAVALHLRRRAMHAENDALMLAATVREQNQALQQALARIAELESRVTDHG